MNGTGSLIMRAERVGSETLLAQIVRMVAEAQRSRAPIQKFADVVAGYFVPIVVGAAASRSWCGRWPDRSLAWRYALVNAVAVLIIACPCALGLATPMSIMVAMGKGATNGILFKNAEAIEVLRKVDTLVVDKTGTLTEGKPQLVSVKPAAGYDEPGLLRLAASLERASEHPLASAIVRGAEARGLTLAASGMILNRVTGMGVRATVDGRESHRGKPQADGRFRASTLAQRRARADGRRHVRRGERQVCGPDHRGRSGERNHSGGDSQTPRGRHPHRDADRRQPHYGGGGCEIAGHRRSDRRGAAARQDRLR